MKEIQVNVYYDNGQTKTYVCDSYETNGAWLELMSAREIGTPTNYKAHVMIPANKVMMAIRENRPGN